ncbi:MAG: phytanoyl-CoA dioxygenase family protein [Novosphingobium sp.]|nr:phytanoyl-CoA dioxygenase family protein [Novosphingobium sp.]
MSDTALVAKPLELDPALVTAFHRDGAVLVRGFLTDAELAMLEAGVEEVKDRPSAMYSRVESSDGSGETIVDQFPGQRSPNLAGLLEKGRSAELAARMLGTDSAQLILDQLFYKTPGRVVPTPWHQDTPFLRVRGADLARVWLTCDPSPPDVTVQVVRGSHLWNVVYDTGGDADSGVAMAAEGDAFSYSGIGDERAPKVPDIEKLRDSFDILSWDVQPGDAVVFHGNVLHGASGKDNHPLPRRAYASMWGGPDLRFHAQMPHAMPLPVDQGDDPVPHGAPIGDYPGVFPVMWRKG